MRLYLVASLLPLTLLASCGDPEVASSAVKQIALAMGDDSTTVLKLSSDDVGLLSREAGVSDDVIRSTAPELDQQSLYSALSAGLSDFANTVPSELRSNLMGLACDGLRGKITNDEQLWQDLLQRVSEVTPDEARSYFFAVRGLWQDLYDASVSTDPDDKASAAIICFTAEQVAGLG